MCKEGGCLAIRLVAMDLDDTLLNDQRGISDENLQALRDAAAAKVKLVFASGRGLRSMQQFSRMLGEGVVAGYIGSNGAQVFDAAGNRLFYNPVPVQDAHSIVAFARERGLYVHTYDEQGFLFEKECDESRFYRQFTNSPGRLVSPLENALTQPVPKLILVVLDPKRHVSVLDELRRLFSPGLTFEVSKPEYIEVIHPSATKGAALTALCGLWGIPREEVMAIGDGGNDLSMLLAAGTPVAMGNAIQPLKQAAVYVTDTNEASGVARAIRRFVL